MNSKSERPDVHMRMMRKYKEAPTWWYMSLFAVVSTLFLLTDQNLELTSNASN